MEFVQTFKDGAVFAVLHVPELENDPNYEKIEPYLTFPVGTYTKLVSNKPMEKDGWSTTYGIVNAFLNQLAQSDKEAITASFAVMHREIIKFFNEGDLSSISMQRFSKTLDEMLYKLDVAVDLCPKLRAYIVENVAIGLFEGAGERAQDSDSLTFYPNEVIDLTTLCVQSKMMSPIFASVMKSLNKKIDNMYRDIHCLFIYTQLLRNRYLQLYYKLHHYVKHTTEQTINDPSLTMLMYGYNIDTTADQMIGELLTRQFVNCDLTVKDGNLMTYVIVAVKRSINTVMSNISKQPAYPRISADASHDEDGNAAQLEIDSISSRKTADTNQIVKWAAELAIPRFMKIYQIEPEEFAANHAFYQRNPIVPNAINQDLASLFYSKALCGAKSIQCLKANEMGKLVMMLQMIVASQDANYDELAHAQTAVPAVDVTLSTSIADGKVKLNAGSSDFYRKCKQVFETSPFHQKGTKSWDSYMASLVDMMLTSSWIYNSSDWLWDFLGQENKNGKIFTPTEKTFTALCSFFLFIWETQRSSNGKGFNVGNIM